MFIQGEEPIAPEQVAVPLDWEDADPAAGRWWYARGRDAAGITHREVFIAEDDVTDSFVALLRRPPESRYTVLTVAFVEGFESRAMTVEALKDRVGLALSSPASARHVLWHWRLARLATLARRNFAFALLGVGAGVVLGLAVAAVAVATGIAGWPIMAAGVGLGALFGPAMKLVVERSRAKAAAGPWGRFAIIMVGAMAGAGLTVSGMMYLFWH